MGRQANPREHGTERGYKQHMNRGEKACLECSQAHTVTMRDYFAGESQGAANKRILNRAQSRARSALVARYRDEFNELVRIELAKEFEDERHPTAG